MGNSELLLLLCNGRPLLGNGTILYLVLGVVYIEEKRGFYPGELQRYKGLCVV